jgi:hypothetical protein
MTGDHHPILPAVSQGKLKVRALPCRRKDKSPGRALDWNYISHFEPPLTTCRQARTSGVSKFSEMGRRCQVHTGQHR